MLLWLEFYGLIYKLFTYVFEQLQFGILIINSDTELKTRFGLGTYR